ncbi:potassium channel family protein [Nanoarchaeota archaeon]
MPKGKKKRVKKKSVPHVVSASDFDSSKTDISIVKLINYNLLFFVPLLVAAIIALKIGDLTSDFFMASPHIVAKILMLPFITVIFLLVVPFIRNREKIAGIRYSIFAMFIVGLGITLPSATQGNYSLLLQITNYMGIYILATFFYAPEVLGIPKHIRDWFKQHKQLLIVGIYLSIVMLNIIGFGFLYFDIYTDRPDVTTFHFGADEKPTIFTFQYFSIVTFSTTGYGEITPASPAARLLYSMEAILGMVINVLFIAILLVFVSNAEYLSQQKEQIEVEETEKLLKKEEKELKKVERDVKRVEEKENFFMGFMNKWFKK